MPPFISFRNVSILTRFNWLLAVGVIFSVLTASGSVTLYLLHWYEKDVYEKESLYIKRLATNVKDCINHAYSINSLLSEHPDIIESIMSSESDWATRVKLYNQRYKSTPGFYNSTGFPLFLQIQKQNEDIELLYATDTNGNQVVSSLGVLEQITQSDSYKLFIDDPNHRPLLSKSFYSMTKNKPLLSILHPIVKDNQWIGIMGMDIHFETVQQWIENDLSNTDVFVILVDSYGVIISDTDTTWVKQSVSLNQVNSQFKTITTHMLKGQNGYESAVEFGNHIYALHYEPIPLPSGSNSYFGIMLVHLDKAMFQTQLNICLFVALFTGTIMFFLLMLFNFQFQKTILLPLKELTIKLRRLIHVEDNQDSHDEIQDLVDTFEIAQSKWHGLNERLMQNIAECHLREKVLLKSEERYQAFILIGLALSAEKDLNKLLELIVDEARILTKADAGTLYIVEPNKQELRFEILHNDSLRIRKRAIEGKIDLPNVPLYLDDGKPNYSNVSSYVALSGHIVNINDVYEAQGFDFSGTKRYDHHTGYRSQSMLVAPIKNIEDEVIGVLQLINAQEPETCKVVEFSNDDERLISSLGAQAAITMTNIDLNKNLEHLFYAFIKSIATAIDEKSPYTGGHIRRVVQLTDMIAQKITEDQTGHFKDVHFTANNREELRIAAWMHDIGKVTTPEHIVDKATKLHTIYDGIQFIQTRFQLIAKVIENNALKEKVNRLEPGFAANLSEILSNIAKEYSFVESCNRKRMLPEDIQKLKQIGSKTYAIDDVTYPYLTDFEIEHLSIYQGTLTDKERKIIESHVSMTMKILDQLPFPNHLLNVKNFASMHHERLDGTGYHKGLKAEDLPLEARIIAIADIFEALTAKDRPYRNPMKLSQAIDIMTQMKNNLHIDPDIFDFFIERGVYKEYARKELAIDQIDMPL
ncbi:MAG: HD domain-containing protein [Desulfobacterales bacterium]|nr:HD domain-containing protein [Desulfobacterales bacterium]